MLDQANSFHSILDISQSTRFSTSFVTSFTNISKSQAQEKRHRVALDFRRLTKISISSTAAIPSSKRNQSSSSDIPSQGLNKEIMRSITTITRTHSEGRSSPAQVQPGSSSRSNTHHSPPLQGTRVSKEEETTVLSVRTEAPVADQIPRP